MHEILVDLIHFQTGSRSILKYKQKFKKIPVASVTRHIVAKSFKNFVKTPNCNAGDDFENLKTPINAKVLQAAGLIPAEGSKITL